MLFRVHDGVSAPDLDTAVSRLRALGAVAGGDRWRVELSADDRKGRVIVEDATFASAEAFERFREHPEHRETAELLATISDWLVGDYAE